MIYTHYNILSSTLKIWISHYKSLNFSFKIYVESHNIDRFNDDYPDMLNYTIDHIADNYILLLDTDLLFSYHVGKNDTMILSSHNVKVKENTIIGRVFYVPVNDKKIYTTFEIPDFILYKHSKHTNYTKDGIQINCNDEYKVSDNLVCLSLVKSPVSNDKEYYETNILYTENDIYKTFFMNKYLNFFMNTVINKEKQYGIIWYPKCGCTTIMSIFCSVNNITIDKSKQKTLNYNIVNKYFYNSYLQNIDMISFVRNPLHRFLSTFFDKHVYKTEYEYFTEHKGYYNYIYEYKVDTIYNLCKYFLSNENNYISEHFNPISNSRILQLYKDKLNCKFIKIEDGLNKHLFHFLNKYHSIDELNKLNILKCYENTVIPKSIENKPNFILNKQYKYYTIDDWLNYLSEYQLNYDSILLDDDLKQMIFKIYINDFLLPV